MTQRLENVIVKTGTREVRKYEIKYENESSGSKRSKVKTIIEKLLSGDMKALEMNYQEGSGFSDSMKAYENGFGYDHGFRVKTHLRTLSDVNADGFLDIVAFANDGVHVALGNSNGTFNNQGNVLSSFGTNSSAGGWTSEKHPRIVQDINMDGLPDIVGFSNQDVYVSLNVNGEFSNPEPWINDFGYSKGWRVGIHPRELHDVDGDGLLDIVGFATSGVVVALNKGTYFEKNPDQIYWSNYFKYKVGGWTCIYPKMVKDMNGDGLPDIVSFDLLGPNGREDYGVYIALNTGSHFEQPTQWSSEFNNGWRQDKHVRLVRDVNGDGLPDIVGFHDSKVYVSINTGKSFLNPTEWIDGFGYNNGFRVDKHLRDVADMNGDGLLDMVAFTNSNVQVAYNTGQNSFGNTSEISDNFESDWTAEKHPAILQDIDGDGITDVLGFGNTDIYAVQNNHKQLLLTNITNDTDQDIEINYKKMTDSTVYSVTKPRNEEKWNRIENDNIPLVLAMPLVSSVESANGVGAYSTIEYKYYDFIINKLRGSQGFRNVWTYNKDTDISTATVYSQIEAPGGVGFQYSGRAIDSAVFNSKVDSNIFSSIDNTKKLSRTVIKYNDAKSRNQIYEPYVDESEQKTYDPKSGTLLKTVTEDNTVSDDGLGNMKKITHSTQDHINDKTFTKVTTSKYEQENEQDWIIGRRTSVTVTHSDSDGQTATRKTKYGYNEKGLLEEEIMHPEEDYAFKKTYEYYPDTGNLHHETAQSVSTSDLYRVAPVRTTYEYGEKYGGKFQTRVTTGAVGSGQSYVTEHEYDERFGTLTKTTDVNTGLVTSWSYDGLGRKVRERRADCTWDSWEYLWSGSDSSPIHNEKVYSVIQEASTGEKSEVSYDALGRETSSKVYNDLMDGGFVTVKTNYNARGLMSSRSLPIANGVEAYIEMFYDDYGRLVRTTKPGPKGLQETTVNYENFTETTTDPNDVQKQTVKNAIGQTLSITDAFGSTKPGENNEPSTITYTYDATGNLLSTTDAEGNVIKMSYDNAGNKVYMNDPDLGQWHYRYDALGKLKYQWQSTTPVNENAYNTAFPAYGYAQSTRVTDKEYDELGRTTLVKTYNNAQAGNEEKQTMTYDPGTGRLHQTHAVSKLAGELHTESEELIYDPYGKVSKKIQQISGRGEFVTQYGYETRHQRLKRVTYPNGYGLEYKYATHGSVEKIIGVDKNGKTKNHYTITKLSPHGQIGQSSYGNGISTVIGYDTPGFMTSIHTGRYGLQLNGGVQTLHYEYDNMGNVDKRTDSSFSHGSIQDTFKYDVHNRLTEQQTDTGGIAVNFAKSVYYGYDRLGNIRSKEAYNGLGRSGGYHSGDHIGTYHYRKYGPHAVDQAGNRHYAYDEVGNMTDRNGDMITYTPSNKVAMIDGKNGAKVNFYYGIGGKRFMKKATEDGKDHTTYYLSKAYEEEKTGNSNEVKTTIYISVGGQTVGAHVEILDKQYVSTNANYKESYNRYFHADALGSITAITDDDGNVIERRSYDPFGKIRAMDYGLTSNNAIIPANTVTQTARAFTGHEQISQIDGLIHMNARVYDSHIGRFTSADTLIQDPHDTQAYNRYSYVRNNPLVYTDPTGHSWFSKLWKKIWNKVIGVTLIVIGALTLSAGIVSGNLGLQALGIATMSSGVSLYNYNPSDPNSGYRVGIGIGGTPGITLASWGGGTSYTSTQSHMIAQGQEEMARLEAARAEVSSPGVENGKFLAGFIASENKDYDPEYNSFIKLTRFGKAELAALEAGLDELSRYLSRAEASLKRWNMEDQQNFRTYYGNTDRKELLAKVQTLQVAVANFNVNMFIPVWSMTNDGHDPFYGLYAPKSKTIMISQRYFANDGYNSSQGALMLAHEFSHYIGWTNDNGGYGHFNAIEAVNTGEAYMNADNFKLWLKGLR